MNAFSSVSRTSKITVVRNNLYPKHTLTCPFVRILFSSAEDFFKLEEETAQLHRHQSTHPSSKCSLFKAVKHAPHAPASSPVVGHGVWDSMSAVIGWVRSCINLMVCKYIHTNVKGHIHVHNRHILSGQGQKTGRQTDIWPEPLMNKNKTQALSSA